MDQGQTRREWLESLDPAEFLELTVTISEIQQKRKEARQRKLEERRTPETPEEARGGRHLRLERVKCGKAGCKKCSGDNPERHGPYWYLYRPKKAGGGRTSEYVGKTLPDDLAEEFSVPEERRTAG